MNSFRVASLLAGAVAVAFACGCGSTPANVDWGDSGPAAAGSGSTSGGGSGAAASGSSAVSASGSGTGSGASGAPSSGATDDAGVSSDATGSSGSSGGSSGSDSGASALDSAGPVVTIEGGANNCPAPPATEPANAIRAVNYVNNIRSLMGVPCAALIPALDTSAQKHCDYYAMNKSNATCTSNAHAEVAGCPLFVGADPGTREKAAGYTGGGFWAEVMAFTGNPDRAVQTWIDSVWHRIETLSPWVRDMGYGGTTAPAGCDTIDFGTGMRSPSTITAVYPYNGQTSVPTSFDGSHEGPMPPAPPTGWPSGYPVTLYLQGGAVQSHQIMVDGAMTPIAHVWIDGTNPTNGKSDYFLYTNTALMPNTTYRVQIAATQGATPLTFDWKFTTGAR